METEEEGALEDCRKAADENDWCKYFEAQGGHRSNYNDMPVKPAYWLELDAKVGEVPINEYGEPRDSVVFGVTYNSCYYLTRFHSWRIQKVEDIEPADSSTNDSSEESQADQLSSFAPLEFCQ